jgi:PAS domain S-box-containing protein
MLSISFVWFVSDIFCKRIGEVVKGAQEIATGSRNRIEVKSHDELGWMAMAINQMLTSLEVSRNKLSEYARDLEVLVDERTKSLKESETTYRTLIENVPIIVYMAMADGTIIFLNKHIELMLDRKASFLSGKHQIWDNYIHPRDRGRVIECREDSLSKGKELHLNYRMVKDNGQVVYAADHAVAVFDEKNNFVRMDGIIVDVTVQKKLHEERLQAEELATLSQVSSRLAHELRNPLTAIGGLTRLLVKSFEIDDPRRKKANLIIGQVVKLEKILQMILTYLGPQHISLKVADFNSIVSEAVEKINMQSENGKLSVALILDRTVGDLELDVVQFKNCLISLIENAFSRMGGEGTVNIRTKRIGEHATVTLSYTVPYITDDDISDFFYPFIVSYPFTHSDNDDVMNVPVCKRIIHNHCGMITVSKEVDNKLCIDISLPLER